MEKDIPLQRIGTPEELAALACFLASPVTTKRFGIALMIRFEDPVAFRLITTLASATMGTAI